MPKFTLPRPIEVEDETTLFDCGQPTLNQFLQIAIEKQKAKLSRTYVVFFDNKLAGYYTLAHIAVAQSETPGKLGRGMPKAILAMLLARLAIDKSVQGRGLGQSLLIDALRKTYAVVENGPAPIRLFVVDAIDKNAKKFYERFDFIASPQSPMRLFMSYKTIQAAIEEDEN
jgi:GNAT superfamily N-acetyltransferase